MRNHFRASYGTAAIAAGVLFLGATNLQAQVTLARTGTLQQANTGVAKATNINPNLYRQNALSRPILQPKQTRRANNQTPNNNLYPNLNQPGGFTPGLNPYGIYPNISQGGYPAYSYPGYFGGFPAY